MNARITPAPLAGRVIAPASKSIAHRAIILAALCNAPTNIDAALSSDDIEATIRCVRKLGAHVSKTRSGLRVTPVTQAGASVHRLREKVELDAGESGSTLRFLVPIVAALGIDARIARRGRLTKRPLFPLDEQLRKHGVTLAGVRAEALEMSGTLSGGTFVLPGNVSSQYISGLLMAAPLLTTDIDVLVGKPIESTPYLQLTLDALARFGVSVAVEDTHIADVRYQRFHVDAAAALVSPGTLSIEGDWSNAAFWLAAGALSPAGVEVSGLSHASSQGDRSILSALALFGATMRRSSGCASATLDTLRPVSLSLADTPDLVAPLGAVAAHTPGATRLFGAGRLALKESDRLATTCAAIRALGGTATHTPDSLTIEGALLSGGTVDAANDHRIAMMASVAAAFATGPTTIIGAECVSKSYPTFFDDFAALGGRVQLEG